MRDWRNRAFGYEYNEEQHIRNEREIAFQEGVERGIEQERIRTEEESKRADRAEKEIERLKEELRKLGPSDEEKSIF